MSYVINILENVLDNYLWIVVFLGSIILIIIFKTKGNNNLISQYFNNKQLYKIPINYNLFLVSLSGSIGLGNIIWVVGSLLKGGPSVIFWIWVGAFFGRYIKMGEIYCSLKYGETYDKNIKFTGPMVYIGKNFGIIGSIISLLFLFCLLMYSVEIYQFFCVNQIVNKLFPLVNPFVIVIGLISLLFIFSGKFFFKIIPKFIYIFFIIYIIFFIGVVWNNSHNFLWFCQELIRGMSSLTSIKSGLIAGISTAIYSGDLGVGYEGVLQRYENPKDNIFAYAYKMSNGIFFDCFICTITIICVMFKYGPSIYSNANELNLIYNMFVNIPYGNYLLGTLIFLAGFSTVVSYFKVGKVLVNYLNYKFYKGKYTNCLYGLYYAMATFLFIFFSFKNINFMRSIMGICGGFLIILNIPFIIYLIYREK